MWIHRWGQVTGVTGVEWGFVTWTADEDGDSDISITAASSTDGLTFSANEPVSQAGDLTVPNGQYLRVSVTFTRASTGETPVLEDLTITANRPPDCTAAVADPDELWPPNHKMKDVNIGGITDPDGNPISIVVTSITQDEPLDTYGDGSTQPDGDGRVYHISSVASDGAGGECGSTVSVCVPHDKGKKGNVCVDGGPLFDSVTGAPVGSPKAVAAAGAQLEVGNSPNPFNPSTNIHYSLQAATHVKLTIFNSLGQVVKSLVDEAQDLGAYSIEWDGRDNYGQSAAGGLYFYRLEAGQRVAMGKMMFSK